MGGTTHNLLINIKSPPGGRSYSWGWRELPVTPEVWSLCWRPDTQTSSRGPLCGGCGTPWCSPPSRTPSPRSCCRRYFPPSTRSRWGWATLPSPRRWQQGRPPPREGRPPPRAGGRCWGCVSQACWGALNRRVMRAGSAAKPLTNHSQVNLYVLCWGIFIINSASVEPFILSGDNHVVLSLIYTELWPLTSRVTESMRRAVWKFVLNVDLLPMSLVSAHWTAWERGRPITSKLSK